MNPDLGGWGRLFGVLSVETALLLLVATGLAFKVQGAQARRLVWRIALVALTLVWLTEGLGGRSYLEFRPLRSGSSSRQIITTTLDAPGFAPSIPETPAITGPATEPILPAPVWWPGLLWLTGTLSYGLRSILARGWLSWRCRKHSSPSLAAVDPFTRATVNELSRVLGLRSARLFGWPELKGPIAFGIFRPTVVVPADFAARFPSDQRVAILAHELGHLAARDPAWLGLAQVLAAMAWWNPLVWWLQVQLRRSSEASADDVSGVIPGGRVALAESLVTLGREWVSPLEAHRLAVTGSGPASELARRVRALLETSETPHPPRMGLRWGLSAGMAMLGFTLLALPVPGEPAVSLPRLLAAAEVNRAIPATDPTPDTEPPTKESGIPNSPTSPAETLSASVPISDRVFPDLLKPSLSYHQTSGESFRTIPLDPSVPVYHSTGAFLNQ